ncbi:MAG TPA: FlgD immunoglobulin-like domain containing protein, partial [Patescibacteria group bacterium]|nr:FlgD immunoglobulin-like domain containing protein [Patescibacteria group bacterium]
YGERLDQCGGIKNTSPWWATIKVENHTATADIGEVNYYTTATTYDVWVKMGSNCPVNDYKLWVEFPKDTLAFAGIVAYGSFTPPLGMLSGDSTKVVVTADDPTNYPPGNPTIVFKIRFNRLFYLPAWTVLPIRFYLTAQNYIGYNMDEPFGWHYADLTLLDGSITIKPVPPPPPPPTCPALFVWNGEVFERENTILAECDGKVVENDVTDYYCVSKRMQADSDVLRFQVREDGEEISTFSNFRLLVVDHPDDKPIHVTREGKIITIGQPHSIIWARDSKGNDITELIATKDGVPYIDSGGGWFDVNFGALSAEEIEGFTALSATKPKDEEENSASGSTTRAPLGAARPQDSKLGVSLKMADGSWRLISSEDARLEPAIQATFIDPALVSPDRELILRYSWDGYYEIDVLDFAKAEPFEGETREMKLSAASHSVAGTIRDRIGAAIGDEPVTLNPGEIIDLAFTVSSLPPYSRGTKRDYIFVATGQYHREGKEETPRAEFALDANFPNPFNPATTIRYNLARPTYVELRIYDVRGALVRTLVSGHQAAGEKQATWDGRLDSGVTAASGVYFYQLKTVEFNRTRKMVLLK